MKSIFLVLALVSCTPVAYSPRVTPVCLRNLDYCSERYQDNKSVSLQDWNNLCAADYQRCEDHFR